MAKSQGRRHYVIVDGVEYKSTAMAFEALGLPLYQVGVFRRMLKLAKRASFPGEKGVHEFILGRRHGEK